MSKRSFRYLFRRNGRGVELTEFGKQFIAEARMVVTSCQTMMDYVDLYRPKLVNEFTVGYVEGAASPFLARAHADFVLENPKADIKYVPLGYEECLPALVDGFIDIAICALHDTVDRRDCAVLPLFPDRFCIVAERSHPLCEKESLCVEDLRGSTVIIPESAKVGDLHDEMVEYLSQLGDDVSIREGFFDVKTLPILLKPENCVSLAQAHLARYCGSEFRFIPLRDGLFHEYLFAAIWKKDTSIARQIRQYAMGFKRVANDTIKLEGSCFSRTVSTECRMQRVERTENQE